MTATEAARDFAALLAAVETGETIVVTRDGADRPLRTERTGVADRIAQTTAARSPPPEAVDDLERAIAAGRVLPTTDTAARSTSFLG